MLSKKKLKSIILILGTWAFLNFLHEGIVYKLKERKLRKEAEVQIINSSEKENNEKSTVVLFTYYRSGSTFTGELFNQHQGN